MQFDQRPFIAIWETTQACDLACVHCRASARPERDTLELSTAEGENLLRRFADEHVPLVVLTGGDPAKRPDLVHLVRFGRDLGLNLGLTPSATPLVTRGLVEQLAEARLSRLAISVDGHEAGVHDTFRGMPGSFDLAERILRDARELGIPSQVNTSVHAGNIDRFAEMAEFVGRAGARLWSVFFIVPTGRAQASMLPSADVVEERLHQLAAIAEQAPFAVKTTAAPHYRRVLLERKKQGTGTAQHGVYGNAGVRINDGKGFLFVSHRGDIYPSGFLPRACGNVRTHDVLDTYQNHPIFRSLRDSGDLTGKCGACEYKNTCGGSRARAYAMTDSLFASDPLCSYIPPGYTGPLDIPVRRHLDVLA